MTLPRWRGIAVLLVLFPAFSPAQVPALRVAGTIRDSVTHEPLPAAIVRVEGTTRGTIANASGQFLLAVDALPATITVSALGYSRATFRVDHEGPLRDILLAPADILMPEVVVTAEDPAMAIMRKAIEHKRAWFGRLHSFRMSAFTRQVLRRDTSIASITESATRGYWRAGDTLREVIEQRRQTKNIQESINFASVGGILNFNEERVRFAGYQFVGPTAEDAFEYYRYTLVRTRSTTDREIYEIRMTPVTRTIPLFQGTVSIAGDSYALVAVDVAPNEAFGFPFVKEWELRYRQQFSFYDTTFWMPTDIRVDGRFVVGVLGISIPPIVFQQTSVISSYELNIPLPDTLFQKPRLVVDTTSTGRDSTLLARANVLPLTSEEQGAYATLDSTQTLDQQFRPQGFAVAFSNSGAALGALSLLDLGFNRVEGAHAGIHVEADSLSPYVVPRGRFAYGFAAKKSSWSLGTTVFTDAHRVFGLGFDYAEQYQRTPSWEPYEPFFSGISSLFWKSDYYDYFRTEGWKAFAAISPGTTIHASLAFLSEQHFDAPKNTDYSFFDPSRPYRENPPADPGRLRSVRFEFRVGSNGLLSELLSSNAAGFSIERAAARAFDGDFTFTQYHGFATVTIPTFGRSFYFTPGFRISAAAGTSSGTLPHQRYFSVESALGSLAPFDVMRTAGVKEFRGTSFVSISVDHNFRSLPFLWLGIPFFYKRNIEFIVHGGAANAWGGTGFPERGNQWHYEVGFGLSRLLDLFRVDASWRLSQPHQFNVTFGMGNIL